MRCAHGREGLCFQCGATKARAEWAAAAGSFTHTYADGASSPTITVSATDEDGTFTLGTKSVTVANVAPAVALAMPTGRRCHWSSARMVVAAPAMPCGRFPVTS